MARKKQVGPDLLDFLADLNTPDPEPPLPEPDADLPRCECKGRAYTGGLEFDRESGWFVHAKCRKAVIMGRQRAIALQREAQARNLVG